MQPAQLDFHAVAGLTASVVAMVAMIPYIASMLRGETRPSIISWWIWTVAGTMLAASYLASGAGPTWWMAAAYVVNPLVIAVLALSYGEHKADPIDWICLAGALSSLIPWFFFDSPHAALYINIFVDLLGALPTLRKSIVDPASENRMGWLLAFCANVINLLAIDRWQPEIFVYPVYAFVITGLIWGTLFRARLAARRPAHAA